MRTTRSHIRVIGVLLAGIVAVAGVAALDPTSACAGPINGTHKNLNRSKTSNVVIIGDSRIEMLAELNNSTTKKASYNATVGAHHIYNDAWVSGTWANKPMVIACDRGSAGTTNYLQQQKNLVRDCLKRHGSCNVVIEATVNDIGFYNWQNATISRMKWLRSQLKSVKVKGKTARVYFTSMAPERNRDYDVKAVNAEIKKAAGSYYINLGINSTWKPYYAGDGVHFTNAGSQKLYKKIMAGIKK